MSLLEHFCGGIRTVHIQPILFVCKFLLQSFAFLLCRHDLNFILVELGTDGVNVRLEVTLSRFLRALSFVNLTQLTEHRHGSFKLRLRHRFHVQARNFNFKRSLHHAAAHFHFGILLFFHDFFCGGIFSGFRDVFRSRCVHLCFGCVFSRRRFVIRDVGGFCCVVIDLCLFHFRLLFGFFRNVVDDLNRVHRLVDIQHAIGIKLKVHVHLAHGVVVLCHRLLHPGDIDDHDLVGVCARR